MGVSRNPNTYSLTTHAFDRAKTRKIDEQMIAETIENGKLKNSHRDDCKLFIKEFHYTKYPVGVVVDVADNEIVTVEYRK